MFKNHLAILTILILAIVSCNQPASSTDEYFNSIKNQPVKLQAFFNAMPKGGDIHHHALGAIPAEELLAQAIEDSLFINPKTGQLSRKENIKEPDVFVLIHDYLALPGSQEAIIQDWTVKDYLSLKKNGREQFFSTFAKFRPAFVGNEAKMLSSLCQKASEDNISYIETQIAIKGVQDDVYQIPYPKFKFKADSSGFSRLYAASYRSSLLGIIERNVSEVNKIYEETNKGATTLRFQSYVVRIVPNDVAVFNQLIVAFETAQRSPHVVGVNFVAPEDHYIALEKYKIHMQMFNYLHHQYPEVKIALHAGELAKHIGEVESKDLLFHIKDAVNIGKASRIGHGVDIMEEENADSILRLLKALDIAVEINLESNEVILEQSPQTHPLKRYFDAGVPICIGSDDEGVLRTNLTSQYVLLVKYLPEITYQELKELSKNPIRYSFLNQAEKRQLIAELDQKFEVFERGILNHE